MKTASPPSNEQKRELIAETCLRAGLPVCRNEENEWRWNLDAGYSISFRPLTSLDAMHEAEQMLTYEQRQLMVMFLQQNFGAGYYTDSHFATAAQRAEAFGRTLNLW